VKYDCLRVEAIAIVARTVEVMMYGVQFSFEDLRIARTSSSRKKISGFE
jgi:hypothetical protein